MSITDPRRIAVSLLAGGGAVLGAAIAGTVFRRSPSRVESMSGKIVVIAGGSRGLGLALAEEFGRAGSRLILAARNRGELDRAKQMLLERRAIGSGDDVLTIACDLKSQAECESLIERATAHFGRVDVLINTLGVIHVGPVELQPAEAFRDAMDTDYFAIVYTSKAVLPQMLARKSGWIVNICSIGGKIPVPHLAPYVGSKFAAVGYSETLNAEVRSRGIRVTTVCPGLMRTGSFPNAVVVGQRQKEYAWFSLAAATPGLAQSAKRAARTIFLATTEGRAEVTVGWDAYLAARLYGIAPDSVQYLSHLANSFILPSPTGSSAPAEGRKIRSSRYDFLSWISQVLTRPQNQPSA